MSNVKCIHKRIHESEYCIECGRPSAETHHVLFGNKDHDNAERYGLTVRMCRECHYRLHNKDEGLAEKYRMLGQLCFEYEFGHEEYMKTFFKNHL